MKILIFGAGQKGTGWIASHYRNYFSQKPGYTVLASPANITRPVEIFEALKEFKPDVVINAAGKTSGPGYNNIDGCEATSEAKQETYLVNTMGAMVLGAICHAQGIRMIHLSSGCIFSGYKEGGYTEEDAPNPVSWYSQTKLWADEALQNFDNVLILRIRMPIDGEVNNRNLITKISSYKKVINTPNSMTVLPDLMLATEKLIELGKTGIYNVVNPGPLEHGEILAMYDEIVDPKHRGTYELIDAKDLQTLAGRSNCVLSTAKLESAGIHLRPASEAVKECLQEYAQAFKSKTAA